MKRAGQRKMDKYVLAFAQLKHFRHSEIEECRRANLTSKFLEMPFNFILSVEEKDI